MMHSLPLLTYVLIFSISLFFFFNDTATTEIYTLSLHDALPIFLVRQGAVQVRLRVPRVEQHGLREVDRKSTRLNSSHVSISYAVFCLKKKKKNLYKITRNPTGWSIYSSGQDTVLELLSSTLYTP